MRDWSSRSSTLKYQEQLTSTATTNSRCQPPTRPSRPFETIVHVLVVERQDRFDRCDSGGIEAPGTGMMAMHTRRIRVKNGRLVLDEPTDLPDGAEVEILVIDDELTAEERAELHASLDRALEDSDAGRGVNVWDYLRRYRADREGRTAR